MTSAESRGRRGGQPAGAGAAASAGEGTGAGAALPMALVLGAAAALEVTLQALRAFFPLGYDLVGSLGFIATPLVLVTVFLAPLLFPLFHAFLGARTPLVFGGALIVVRVLLQVWPSLPMAIAAVAIGVLTMTAVLAVLGGSHFGPDALASATLVGLGLDIGLRAWRVTDDVVWSDGWLAWWDPSLLVPLVMLAVFLPGLRGAPGRAPAFTWAVLLMPQVFLWASLAFVGSSGGVSLPVATLVMLAGVSLAMLLLAWPPARLPWPASAVVVLVAAAAMPQASGWVVLLLAVSATVATPLLLREAAILLGRSQPMATSVGSLPQSGRLAPAGRPGAISAWSPWRHAGASAGGWVTMFILLLLYALHYEIPLPIENVWLPAIAVLIACIPLVVAPIRNRPAAEYGYAAPSRLHVPAVALVGAGAVVVAGMVQVGMVGGSPLPGPDDDLTATPSDSAQPTIATYNTGQGQNATTGRLSFREVAEVIVGLDADVVALQEVARGWPLTAMSDFDAWLRAHTDLMLDYIPAADRQFGNALASRIALTDVTGIDLGQQGGAQRRSAIRAALPDGTLVYAMHLQARNSEPAEQSRLEQMQIVLDDWDGAPATVLAGDLNPRNDYADDTETPPKIISNLEVFLEAGFLTSQPTDLCTLPTSNDNCSDYIFITPDLTPAGPMAVVPVEVSDHRPVLARLAGGVAQR